MMGDAEFGSQGAWIVLEGGEGCGKTTQAQVLGQRLNAVVTREPGGTLIGSRIREITHDSSLSQMCPRTEALLMAADRAQHFAEVIWPALRSGRHVVSDRSVYSSMAYQGFGRGLDQDWIWELGFAAYEGVAPDAVVLLDAPDSTLLQRRRDRRVADRFEAESPGFHRRVIAGFREMAAGSNRWLTVDASGSIDEVTERIVTALRSTDLLRSYRLGWAA